MKVVRDQLTEIWLSDFADATNGMVSKTYDNWSDFNVNGTGSVESLVNANYQLRLVPRLIQSSAHDALISSKVFTDINQKLLYVNLAISHFTATWAIASKKRTRIFLVAEFVKTVLVLIQQYWGARAFVDPFKELMVDIPYNLERGVDAAFDLPTSLPTYTFNPGPRNLIQNRTTNSNAFHHPNTGANLSEAFTNYNHTLQVIHSLVLKDSIEAARQVQITSLTPASKQLFAVLNDAKTILDGGMQLEIARQELSTDSLFEAYTNGLFAFHAAHFRMPWRFIQYLESRELEDGTTGPGYPTFKEETVQLLEQISMHSNHLEKVLLATLDQFTDRGFIQPTAVVDSLWMIVNDEPSDIVASSPANIIVHARVRNLSDQALSGLSLTLATGDTSNLRFMQGGESIIRLKSSI